MRLGWREEVSGMSVGVLGATRGSTPRAAGVPAAAALCWDDVTAVRAAARRLTANAVDVGDWSGAERHRLLTELDRAVDALTAVRATVLVAEREAGTWQGAGDR